MPEKPSPEEESKSSTATSEAAPGLFSRFHIILTTSAILLAIIGFGLYSSERQKAAPTPKESPEPVVYTPIPKTYLGENIVLPDPKTVGAVSLEETLASRRSRREFDEEPITLAQVSQILWGGTGDY